MEKKIRYWRSRVIHCSQWHRITTFSKSSILVDFQCRPWACCWIHRIFSPLHTVSTVHCVRLKIDQKDSIFHSTSCHFHHHCRQNTTIKQPKMKLSTAATIFTLASFSHIFLLNIVSGILPVVMGTSPPPLLEHHTDGPRSLLRSKSSSSSSSSSRGSGVSTSVSDSQLLLSSESKEVRTCCRLSTSCWS